MPRYKQSSDGYFRCQEIYNGVKIDIKSKDEKILIEKIRKRKNDIDSGSNVGSINMTVEVWANEWLEVYKKPAVIEKSYKLYKTHINKYIIPYIGKFKIKDVKPMQLQKILNSQEGMSTSHIEHVKNTIKGIFKSARREKFILDDPSEYLTSPSGYTNTHRPITVFEEALLFGVCKTHYFSMFAYLMYYLGMRPQECSELRWEDINLIQNTVEVNKATESGTLASKSTKTESGVRTIPIPDEFIPILKEKKLNKRNSDYVITDLKGRKCSDNKIQKYWYNFLRNMDICAGAEVFNNQIIKSIIGKIEVIDDESKMPKQHVVYNLSSYCLRHTYCTNLQRAGVSLNVAKYLMGHSDIKMTANIYTHMTDDQSESARQYLNDYYKNKCENIYILHQNSEFGSE